MTEERHNLTIDRPIDAPVAQVWRTMIDRFDDWFCPRPWRAETRTIDWRPGGRSIVVMHGPDGEEIVQEGMILAFEPNSHFVFTDAITGDYRPAGPFMSGVFAVEAEGSGTRYRATARHWTREAMERHRQMGFDTGWGAAADQLKQLAEAAS